MESPLGQGSKATRFLVEAFVIVSSILLAFGIDAWWDARLQRVEEAEILAGLHREFTGNREALTRGIEQHGTMLAAFSSILASIEQGEWTSAEWAVDDAIGQLLTPPTSDLGNGVRDALVQAGRLEIISNALLRERLAEWPAFYEEVLDDQVFSREVVLYQVLPFFMRQGLDLSATLVSGTMVVEPGAEAWPVAVARIGDDQAATRRLLSNAEFRSLVQVRYSYWHHAGREYRAALGAAVEILRLIEEAM
jgi:hypothetical protein